MKGRGKGLNPRDCGGMRRTVIQSVSKFVSSSLSRMTYEAQLLLQIQRHGARCGTFSRVKVLEKPGPCLGEYGQPVESAGGLTRSRASDCECTVIGKAGRRLTGCTTWTGGAAAAQRWAVAGANGADYCLGDGRRDFHGWTGIVLPNESTPRILSPRPLPLQNRPR